MEQETDNMIMKWLGYALLVVGSTFVVTGLLNFSLLIYGLSKLDWSQLPFGLSDAFIDLLVYSLLLSIATVHVYFLLAQAAKRVVQQKRIKTIVIISTILAFVMIIEVFLAPIFYNSSGDLLNGNFFFFYSIFNSGFFSSKSIAEAYMYLGITTFLFILALFFAIYKEKKNQKKLTESSSH
jgi:hypothetical protein